VCARKRGAPRIMCHIREQDMDVEAPDRDVSDWTSGNTLVLLENGEELYPRILDAIAGARKEIVLETFIWREDGVGLKLLDALVAAAERGVDVRVLVDGYGSPAFSKAFLERVAK